MKRKLMPYGLALWAALPMAQTSKIEGRLRLILNGHRDRRMVTRGALSLAVALAFGIAIVVATLETPPRSLKEALLSGQSSPDTPAHLSANIAYLQVQIKRFGDADPWAGKAYYELGLAQDDKASYRSGIVQEDSHRYDEALASFDKAIALPEPPYADSGIHSAARYTRISTLTSADRYEEATAETEALLKSSGRGMITADLRENLRERLPEFKMMGAIEASRAAEQGQFAGLTATPRWTQTLSNGVTIQLLGVMQTAGTRHTVWSPEGKFLSEAQYKSDAGHGGYEGLQPTQKVEMVLRFAYPSDKALLTGYDLSGSVSHSFQSGPDRNGGKVVTDESAVNRETDGCRIIEVWFPAGQTQTDLRAGIALIPPPAGPSDPTDAPKEWAQFDGVTLPPIKP